MKGFPATSIFDPTLLPQSGAGEGNGYEFGSPRRGEENRGGQSKERGAFAEQEEWCLGVTSTDADGNIGFS